MEPETKAQTVTVVADAVDEIVDDAQTSQTFGQFVARLFRSRTILGLLVILAPFLSRRFQWDPSFVEITLGTLIVLIGRLNPEIKPLVGKAAAPLLLISILVVGGCADNPRTLDLKANRLVATANASVMAARSVAPALGMSRDQIRRVEREVIVPALAAERELLAQLDAASDAYTLAVAAKDQTAIDAASDRGRIAFNGLLAVTNRVTQVLIQYQSPATRPAQ